MICQSPCGNPVLKGMKLSRNTACWLDNWGTVSLGKDKVQICLTVDHNTGYMRQLIKARDCWKVYSIKCRGRDCLMFLYRGNCTGGKKIFILIEKKKRNKNRLEEFLFVCRSQLSGVKCARCLSLFE